MLAAEPNLVLVVMLGTGLRANSSVRHLHHALIPRVPSAQGAAQASHRHARQYPRISGIRLVA